MDIKNGKRIPYAAQAVKNEDQNLESYDHRSYEREVTGSNPVEVLTFSGFYTQLLKLRS